ncbi:MAG: (2Fe-2S)-binding protein [Betaproteobacteria bacterium]
MFARLPDRPGARASVELVVDGMSVDARDDDTVAAAMLAAGLLQCRTTPATGAPRAPHCLMGVCFECLVTIDGRGSQQACMVAVAPGMRVETQHGARSFGTDPAASA